jgi:serine acetyltransferase
LGNIAIGDDVLIGANAVVHENVPQKSVVAAPQATVISGKGSESYIGNPV